MAHIEKFKRADLDGLFNHVERTRSHYGNENIDPTRTALNYRVDGLESTARELWDDAAEGCPKTIRKDAVCAFSVAVTLPRDWPTNRHPRQFFELVHAYNVSTWPTCRPLGAHVHMDETTPHMHDIFAPTDDAGAFSFKRVCPRAVYANYHDGLQRYIERVTGLRVSVVLDEGQRGEKALSRLGQSDYVAAKKALETATRRQAEAERAAGRAEQARRRSEQAERDARGRAETAQKAAQEAERERDEVRAERDKAKRSRDAYAGEKYKTKDGRVLLGVAGLQAKRERLKGEVKTLKGELETAKADRANQEEVWAKEDAERAERAERAKRERDEVSESTRSAKVDLAWIKGEIEGLEDERERIRAEVADEVTVDEVAEWSAVIGSWAVLAANKDGREEVEECDVQMAGRWAIDDGFPARLDAFWERILQAVRRAVGLVRDDWEIGR